jgi:serine/threonine protein kinase
MDQFTQGQNLTFERICPLPIECGSQETGLELTLEANILKRIRIGPSRRSQVVLVSVDLPSAGQGPFVAKCFDPSFCPPDEAAEARQTISKYCATRSKVEEEAYERLAAFQGQYIPKFYGRYRYASTSGYATAILLEYVCDTSLDDFRDGLPRSELLGLLDIGTTALEAIHACGIFHYDIQPSNVLWSPEKKALRIVDWEFARRDPPSKSVEDWTESDRLELRRALECCGLPRSEMEIPDGASWVL